MHDIDQNLMETTLSEYETTNESGFNQFENEYDISENQEGESALSEADELELASELMGVSSEAELDQFFGSLKNVLGKVGKVVTGPVGKSIGTMLKGIAKQALPTIGKMAGTYFGGPAGGAIGSQLGSYAGKMFEMEFEGLTPEDRDFEVAKRFSKFAAHAIMNAASAPRNAAPHKIAKNAIVVAAKKHAPGLLKPVSSLINSNNMTSRPNSGKWVRIPGTNSIKLIGI